MVAFASACFKFGFYAFYRSFKTAAGGKQSWQPPQLRADRFPHSHIKLKRHLALRQTSKTNKYPRGNGSQRTVPAALPED